MIKILHIVGARPQFIKLFPLHLEMKERGFNQKILHTGQHFDKNMSDVFFNEMDALELLDRIIIVTTSEFGRRVYENASEGTDHGTSAPVFIFGSGLNGGVFGDDPDLTTLDNNGNLHVQYD